MSAYLYATSYLLTATDPLNIPAPIISERGWWFMLAVRQMSWA